MKFTLSAALAALVATAAFGQVDLNRTVAVVNGEEIKGGEYYHRMEYLPGVGKRMGSAYSELPPGFLTIEQLITDHLVLQLAKEKGVLPTDMEVEAEYRVRKDDTPNLDTLWTATGQSLDDLRYQIRLDVAKFKIQTFGITITNQEIDTFYKEHPTEFTIPKRYQLRVIVVGTAADRDAVDKALAAGTKFPDVASQYSMDVSKTGGGEYGTVPETALAATFKNAVDATKIGATTSWITSAPQGGGDPSYIKFLVEDVKKQELIPLDDKIRRQTRRRLMMDRGAVKNNIEQEMKAMRLKAKIDIKQPEFRDAYKKFIDAYLKEGGKS